MMDHQKLVDWSERLMTLVSEYEQVLQDAAEAEAAYKVAFAEALIRSDASNADKQKAEATRVTKKELYDYYKTKAAKEFYKERFENARTAISAMKEAMSSAAKADQSTLHVGP